MNKADSERIAADLENKGYKLARKEKEADLIIINMCSVRQSAVDRVFGKINQLSKSKNLSTGGRGKKLKIALAGCVLKSDFKNLKEKIDLFLKNKNYLKLSPCIKEKSRALIPISYGCSNFCSYCVVPYTRGSLICRDHKEIIKEVRGLIKSGAREIWLLGQNVNDYKKGKINFPKLLKMVNNLPGNFKVFFLSSNPKDFSDELIETITKGKKIAKQINLPFQSGDNKILRAMNRPYTVKKIKYLVKKIRKKIPNINISTDIIVGFPGETRKQFENTRKLAKELKFYKAFVAKYSPRKGTKAFKLKDNVSLKEKKRRWNILNKLINEKK